MSDEEQEKPENVAPIAPKRREQRVKKLTGRVRDLESIADYTLMGLEDLYKDYVAIYRARYGCDPDTNDVPLDHLGDVTKEEESSD